MDITQEAIGPLAQQDVILARKKTKIFKAVSEVDEKIAKLKLSINKF